MAEHKFKVGDKVKHSKYEREHFFKDTPWEVGTVTQISDWDDAYYPIVVDWPDSDTGIGHPHNAEELVPYRD